MNRLLLGGRIIDIDIKTYIKSNPQISEDLINHVGIMLSTFIIQIYINGLVSFYEVFKPNIVYSNRQGL